MSKVLNNVLNNLVQNVIKSINYLYLILFEPSQGVTWNDFFLMHP
jgi:hypothetical protein